MPHSDGVHLRLCRSGQAQDIEENINVLMGQAMVIMFTVVTGVATALISLLRGRNRCYSI